MEKQYVDDGFPTDFPVVAPFLADIDTSGGRGQIYYRVTETPSVLNRVAQVCLTLQNQTNPLHPQYWALVLLSSSLHCTPTSFLYVIHSFGFIHLILQEVQRGFPDAKFTPTHAVVATWESVAAYEEQARTAGPSNKVRWIRSLSMWILPLLLWHTHCWICIPCDLSGVGQGSICNSPYPPNLVLNLSEGGGVTGHL